MSHYTGVRLADPVGMCQMYEPYCATQAGEGAGQACGWVGEATPEPEEASALARRHERENYEPTWDDICWSLGIGKHGQ